jgi:hypothetical protein
MGDDDAADRALLMVQRLQEQAARRAREEEAARQRLADDIFCIRLDRPPSPTPLRQARGSPGQGLATSPRQTRSAGPSSHHQGRRSRPQQASSSCRYPSRSTSSQEQRAGPFSRSGSFLSSQGSSPRQSLGSRSSLSSSGSPHVPGCRCQTCKPAAYLNLYVRFAALEMRRQADCERGCRCLICLEESDVLRGPTSQPDCQNDGHLLPVNEQCDRLSCTCKFGCSLVRCARCNSVPTGFPWNAIGSNLADKPRTSPSPPRQRGPSSGGGSRVGSGKGRDQGDGNGSQGSGGDSLSPHASKRHLRRRRPSR